MFKFFYKLKNKKEKGVGELISFLVMLPIIMICFLVVVYIMQMALTAQALSYTVYSATRAAVVSDTSEMAQANADAIVEKCLPNGYMSIRDAKWSYEVVDGDPNVWVKGNLIRGEVTLKTTTFSLFGRENVKEMKTSIVCMVERPAT